MPIKLPCPHCGHKNGLTEPLPHAGDQIGCTACGQKLMVSYPPGAVEKLTERGKKFRASDVPQASPPPRPNTPGAKKVDPFSDDPALKPTAVDPTMVQEPTDGHFDRTVPSQRSPHGQLPGGVPEPDAKGDVKPPRAQEAPIPVPKDDDATEKFPDDPTGPVNKGSEGATLTLTAAEKEQMGLNIPIGDDDTEERLPAKGGMFGCLAKLTGAGMTMLVGTSVVGLLGAVLVGAGGYWHFSQGLPTGQMLQEYQPPRVTEVYDHKGELLGEIYEQRRYVLPFEKIPTQMQDAFIAAEDEAFWDHGGVDWAGLVAAVVSEVTSAGGGKRGASTITMQVTRNFLLTRQKTYERKIREIILARRLEANYTKEHILYLYLNEIYLGSGAYGVEAASRTYFDKHIEDCSLAEMAMIAGLAPAPSAYSPHKNFDKAKVRQEYVLSRMLEIGKITQAEHDAAVKEEIRIVERSNEFLTTAPHFTEYARRYLVDTYGHDRVYNEGLKVWTTTDLELQKLAQEEVFKGVHLVDQRMGFRREVIETLADDAAIQAKRDAIEQQMRQDWAKEQDAAGRLAAPDKSVVEKDRVYTGVVLEVSKRYARVGIGDHEGIIPLEWTQWGHPVNPKRSWRYWKTDDLTTSYDWDGDRKKDGAVLRKGDVVQVKVLAESTRDKGKVVSSTSAWKMEREADPIAPAFKRTPGEKADLLALHLWQTPEIEAALLSFDLETGAVRSMVGGWNYEKSEFNRALQSYRQVGSTFKPIVYAAGIDSRKVTTATMVTDAPLAFQTDNDFIWKPANYGNDYLGNITLKNALAASRNTCTVRVLEQIDPGMNDDVIYTFARKLGIGGPPTHLLPEDHIPLPSNDHLCPWTLETKESTICMDRNPPKDPNISNTRHRMQLKPGDEYHCRSCDLSMGLGSASLTMEELLRAYSAFGTGGYLIEPYYIERVEDVDGNVLEEHQKAEPVQVMEPEVAYITNWLLQGVVQGGTASKASRLHVHLAGKTGTSNDEKDTWFVGMSPNIVTASWVGFDQPKTLGVSSTGGRTALPIWMEYMRQAAPKEDDRRFPEWGEIEWAQIEEENGRHVTSGGKRYPFLKDTVPESTGISAGQISLEDLGTEEL